MKILIKTAIVSAVLFGSGFTQAATTTASIPMGVEVPRSCTLSNVSSSIVVPEDGSEATGRFTMNCNVDVYNFYITTDSLEAGNLSLQSTNGVKLPLQINQTYMFNSVAYGNILLSASNRQWSANGILPIGAPIDAILKFKLMNPTTATTPAGVYTDTFRVNVNY
jgi:bifunctional ADP-heptose synthase (sugar kinase/adenylyltransferase)